MIELKKRRFSFSEEGMLQFQLRYHADTEDEALFQVPSTFRGLPRSGHNAAEWDAGQGQYIIDVTYKGLVQDGPEGGPADQYEIQGEFREEGIESNPHRAILEEDWGAYEEDGRLKFQPFYNFSKSGGTGLAAKKGPQPNPFFNVTTYPVYFEVATHTYVRKRVPPSVHRRKGTVVNKLPAGFQYNGDSEFWFVDAPSVSKIGNAWRIREVYKDLTEIKYLYLLAGLVKK